MCLGRSTFELLVQRLNIYEHSQDWSPERVGLALWRIATGNSFRSCGLQFGLGKSTEKYICVEFEQPLVLRNDQFIQFPITREAVQNWVMDEFEEKYAMPQIVGAIRCNVERAFRIWKGRWGIGMKKIEQNVGTVNKSIIAACILHNVCIFLNWMTLMI